MSTPPLISWADIETLGGRQEGDPHAVSFVEDDPDGKELYRLPDAGYLALRVLWRHLGGPELASMEVPDLRKVANEWAIGRWAREGATAYWLGHNDIDNREEALATIVADEARKVRGE